MAGPLAAPGGKPARARARARPARFGCLTVSLVLLLVTVLLVTFWRPANVAWRTAVLMPHLFPEPPLTALDPLFGAPTRETVAFSPTVADAEADLYLPPGDGPHGVIILLLGAFPFPRDAPQLVRLAEGLARAGVGCMLIQTPDLRAGYIRPTEVVPIADAWRFTAAHPRVDPTRIGYVALSAGGSLLLLSLAQDAEFGRDLNFATVFGAYTDAEAMVRTMATNTATYHGVTERWEPAPLARRIFAGALIDVVEDPAEREALYRRFVLEDDEAQAAVDALTGDAAALRDMLLGVEPDQFDTTFARIAPEVRARLRELSPSQVAGRIRTPVFVMHDRSDQYVPYLESRKLVDQIPPGVVVRYTEFDLFDHVNPVKSLDPGTFLSEVSALYRHLYDMLWRVT